MANATIYIAASYILGLLMLLGYSIWVIKDHKKLQNLSKVLEK